MIALLIVATVTAHPLLLSPTQFDLICSGHEDKVLMSQPEEGEDVVSHLRLDLVAKVWCGGKCDHIYDIEGTITPAEIVLSDSDHDQFTGHHSDDWEEHFSIDRSTGKYTISHYLIQYGKRTGGFTHGTCSPAPFSGMPATKF